ncbi:hypothetical protein C8Q76DRAFT_692760 [Earliella scabrosa]|nr:hypothetical protein C8Q76DRAFT_692760 [Earliella scabrosa]
MGKLHLYLAAYDDTRVTTQGLKIHWALLLAPEPKREDPMSFAKSTTRFHVTNKNGHWAFECRQTECVRTPAMLGRVFVGTISKRHLIDVEERLSDPRRIRAGNPHWDCRRWVEEALVDLARERILHLAHVVQLDHLFAFAQRFSEEVIKRGLNVGYDVPITVNYPGPGPIPHIIIK